MHSPTRCQAKTRRLPRSSEVQAIYNRMMALIGAKDQQALADLLGKSVLTIRQHKSEGRLPDEYVYRCAYETDCNVEWLRTGVGVPDRHPRARRSGPRLQLDDFLNQLDNDLLIERIYWLCRNLVEYGKNPEGYRHYMAEALQGRDRPPLGGASHE
jgi:hypothetical protein